MIGWGGWLIEMACWQLFDDYMEEISDPATRAEHDAYLRQLEEEGGIEVRWCYIVAAAIS